MNADVYTVPGMTDTAIILLCLLMLIGGAAIYAMLTVLTGRGPEHAEESPLMRVCLALVLAIGAYLIIWPRDEALPVIIARDRPLANLIAQYCPPPTAGLSETVTLFLRSQADRAPEITRCSRYVLRESKPRAQLKLTEARR